MKQKKISTDISKKPRKARTKKAAEQPEVFAPAAMVSPPIIGNKKLFKIKITNLIMANIAEYKYKLINMAKKEITLFKNSKYPITFKPFLAYQGLAVLAVILVATVSVGDMVQLAKINASTIKNVSVKQNTTLVANGSPVEWSALVNLKDIKSGKHLLKLPKGATNIKIQKITPKQASAVLQAKPKEQVSLKQRQQLALAKAPAFAKASAGKSKSIFAKIFAFSFADLGSAVENAGQAITQAVNPEPDITTVDLSSVIPANAGIQSSDATEPATSSEQVETPATPSSIEAGPLPAADTDVVKVDYETPAPVITEQATDTGKQVTVSAANEDPAKPLTDVLASTKIPEIFKVGQENKIKIKWKTGPSTSSGQKTDVSFFAYDTDSNGYLDYVEWTVPHLSDQVFDIIFISKAFQLDENQNIVADIYPQVETKDGIYAAMPNGNYVRVTFNKILTDKNDITIYAKPDSVIASGVPSGSEAISSSSNTGIASSQAPRNGESSISSVIASEATQSSESSQSSDGVASSSSTPRNDEISSSSSSDSSVSSSVIPAPDVIPSSTGNPESVSSSLDSPLQGNDNSSGVSSSSSSDSPVSLAKTGFLASISSGFSKFAHFFTAGLGDALQNIGITPSPVRIEVYPVYTDADGNMTEGPLLATVSDGTNPDFSNIDHDGKYRILLKNLSQPTDVFDLKVTAAAVIPAEAGIQSSAVEIDYIVDPTPATVTDNFSDSTKIASSTNITVASGVVTLSAASSWTCGSSLVDARDGQSYSTVLIGAQCWMAQNLNVGTRISSCTAGDHAGGTCASYSDTTKDQTGYSGTTCGTIQKYCYNDTVGNCTRNVANNTDGGLYQWAQAMCGSTTAGVQGICPTGWHLPTDAEYIGLEEYLGMCTGVAGSPPPYCSGDNGQWRGTTQGTTLKTVDATHFSGLLAGRRGADGSFGNLTSYASFWSSLQSGGNAFGRYLFSGYAAVSRNAYSEALGFSVRCLKN
jgi:uncharacterized protein (TIGR02145 family)